MLCLQSNRGTDSHICNLWHFIFFFLVYFIGQKFFFLTKFTLLAFPWITFFMQMLWTPFCGIKNFCLYWFYNFLNHLFLLSLSFSLCFCVCACACTCAYVLAYTHTWIWALKRHGACVKSRGHHTLVLPFYCVGPADRTQGVRLKAGSSPCWAISVTLYLFLKV